MNASLSPMVEDAIDQDFLVRLYRSIGPVFAVAAWAVRYGYDVRIPGLKVRPDRSQWRQYSDHGDLFWKKGDEPERRIEVKSTKRPFTSAQDWPFPDMLICAAKDWDEADPKPHRYIIVNPACTHAAIVRGEQITEDLRRDQRDDARQMVYPAYAITPRELRFVSLEA